MEDGGGDSDLAGEVDDGGAVAGGGSEGGSVADVGFEQAKGGRAVFLAQPGDVAGGAGAGEVVVDGDVFTAGQQAVDVV